MDRADTFREVFVEVAELMDLRTGTASLEAQCGEISLASAGRRPALALPSALILLGTHVALGKHLPQAEIVFEYRSSEAPGPASQREEFREGFFLFYDRLWDLVNLRNDKQHYQDGLFMRDIPTFSEGAVREATLNAASHRDYRHAGSVFIRQFSRRIEIVSPGGFPQGTTPDNILDRQQPRSRRIADIFGKCGLVERAGQGADRIFEACIREGKALLDFAHTDAYQVSLTLHGEVQDPQFVRFLERVSVETSVSFDTHDFLVLDRVHRGEPVPPALEARLQRLTDLGVVESLGRGKALAIFCPADSTGWWENRVLTVGDGASIGRRTRSSCCDIFARPASRGVAWTNVSKCCPASREPS